MPFEGDQETTLLQGERLSLLAVDHGSLYWVSGKAVKALER